MSRLREHHALVLAAFLFGPIALLAPLGMAPLFVLSALAAISIRYIKGGKPPSASLIWWVFLGSFLLNWQPQPC